MLHLYIIHILSLYIFIYALYPTIYNNKANLRDLIVATGLVIWNWIQIVDFSGRVTLKLDGWVKKTIGHFFYTTSSFVQHFKSISEFKLELQSGNAQFGSNWWIGHLFYATLSIVHDFKAMDEFWLELHSGNDQFGSNPAIYCPVWPWYLIDDLKNQ